MRLPRASQKIFCRYTNVTARIQIVKVVSMRDHFLERAVMPSGSILFEAHQDACLEVHTSEIMSAIVSDVIPCWQLDRRLDQTERPRQRTLKIA